MLHLNISASSQTGLVREHNEDAVLVSHEIVRDMNLNTSAFLAPDGKYIVAVCDGMGGCNAGEVASKDAAEQLGRRVESLPAGLTMEGLRHLMDEWIQDEHAYLLYSGTEDPETEGMGTTLVGMLYYEGHVCWLNCGDSRLYRLRRGILRQVSTDHSLIRMTHNSSDAHVIVNCLGAGADDVFLDFVDVTKEVKAGDIFLLCSDGLTDCSRTTKLRRC